MRDYGGIENFTQRLIIKIIIMMTKFFYSRNKQWHYRTADGTTRTIKACRYICQEWVGLVVLYEKLHVNVMAVKVSALALNISITK